VLVASPEMMRRLRGHRDQITDLKFIREGRMLVSSSKDTYIKVTEASCPCSFLVHR
jgi:WD40 repeat protein